MLDLEVQTEQEEATLELYIEHNHCNVFDTLKETGLVSHALFNNILSSEEKLIIKELTATNGQKTQLIYSSATKMVSAYINEGDKIVEIKNENTPKNLRYLNNLGALEAFCTNAYAKVVILSNGDYKLYIEHKGLGGMISSPGVIGSTGPTGTVLPQFEDESESITPRTVNTEKSQLINSKTPYIVVRQYQEDSLNIKISPSKPCVTRIAIKYDSPSLNIYISSFTSTIPTLSPELHQIEKEVFAIAFKKIMATSSANDLVSTPSKNFPNNVLLVDFFERDPNTQKIKINSNGLPKAVHTICLWKKENSMITLIDPSNYTYSSFLESLVEKVGQNEFPSLKLEIKPHGNKHKFYKGANPSYGRGENDSRDCTDIAVKIAFKLNEEQINNINNVATILDSINFLSNQKAINISSSGTGNKSIVVYDDMNMRELQASSAAIRNDTVNLLEKYKGNPNLTKNGGVTTLTKLKNFDTLLTRVESFRNQPEIDTLLKDLSKLQVDITRK